MTESPAVLSAADVAAGLGVVEAADALAEAFGAGVELHAPQRTHLELADASFLVMPAVGAPSGTALAGTKLVSIRPANADRGLPSVQAVYVVFGGESAGPLAIIDGAGLTNLRTSAVSAVATRLLARPDAARLVLFGAGAQARAHLTAMSAVRPVREVVVVSRTRENAELMAAEARARGLEARVGQPDDVVDADLVCTCTTSPTPLFDGTLLARGAHVNAIGSYQPHTRELDEATMRRARLVVEDREAALAEAGELVLPLAAGTLAMTDVLADLAELCRGAHVRTSAEDITVFKSVGLAMEDLVVAAALLRSRGESRSHGGADEVVGA